MEYEGSKENRVKNIQLGDKVKKGIKLKIKVRKNIKEKVE